MKSNDNMVNTFDKPFRCLYLCIAFASTIFLTSRGYADEEFILGHSAKVSNMEMLKPQPSEDIAYREMVDSGFSEAQAMRKGHLLSPSSLNEALEVRLFDESYRDGVPYPGQGDDGILLIKDGR